MTWGELLTHDNSPLTNHEKSKHKQGKAVVLGETIDGNRNAESVKSLYAVVIDIDSGPKVDDVIEKLQEKGLFALVYTSFNHNKTKVVLKHDDVVRKLKLDDTPNRMQVIEYLRAHHKDRYDEDFLEGIEIVDARSHGPKGLQIVLETPPLHKFRIVLPLEQPVQLADLGTTAAQWKDAWADLVTGFVVNELDVSFDSTSCDVNRLFYTPRHPKDGEWDCVLIQGKPLNVDDIEPHSKNAYLKNRDNDPFAYGLDKDDSPPICMTPKGKSLNGYHAKFKDRLLLPDLILAEAPDKVRREVSDGKIEIECPFEHEHSTEGGTGTVCMSPEVNEYGYWTVSCPHDACQGRHKLEFLEEMLEAGWFEEELLWDPEYLLGAEDDEELPGQGVTSDKAPTPLSAPLWDEGLVEDGFCKRKNVTKIRQQIKKELRSRVSHVIVEGGKGKLFLHPDKGRLPEIWDDTALDKFCRNRRVKYEKKDGSKPGVINPATEFFEDELRTTYVGTQFEPDTTKVDPHKFNLFNGFPYEPASAGASEGDWSLMREHIKDNLIAGNGATPEQDESLFNYWMTWHADIFQNPGRKKGTSIAILGEQGVGKSKFYDWFRVGLADYAIKVSSKKYLVGSFNAHLDSKLLVVAEEAFWSGDKESASVLKDFISSETYTVERKGVDAVERRNLIRTVFVTNNDWAIPTDDNADARRFLVLRAGTAQKQNGDYFAKIDAQMRNGGLEAMVHEFMTWDPAKVGMSFDDLRAAPWTPARAEQASYSASAPKALLLQIIGDGSFTDREGIDFELSDTEPTRVRRADLVEVLQGKAQHGGARKAVVKAIEEVLGEGAWHDHKHMFNSEKRERYVEFPPLDELRQELLGTYR